MRFSTIIIGGGLAGLCCGIRLQKAGVQCAIVSAGQSALHFFSGSFELLNVDAEGKSVDNPVVAIEGLPESHPYKKINDFSRYAEEVKSLLTDCGVDVNGDAKANHFHFTPMGTLKRSWLSLGDFNRFDSMDCFCGKKVVVVNIAGFLDFNMKFVCDAFTRMGAKVEQRKISLEATDKLRTSPTEMRASNIARVLDVKENQNQLLTILKDYSNGVDVVALPAVFGLDSTDFVKTLKREVPQVVLIPSMPPSVPGIRVQQRLRREFERTGGVFMLGDSVVKADFEGNRVVRLFSRNHEDMPLTADNVVLATGSFFSSGLVARSSEVIEPVMHLDVDFDSNRSTWYDAQFFNPPGYMKFGVATNNRFQVKRQGETIENVYAIGSVLSGFNALAEGCGAGVSMLTALAVADEIIKQ